MASILEKKVYDLEDRLSELEEELETLKEDMKSAAVCDVCGTVVFPSHDHACST